MKSLYDQARALFTPELMDRLEIYFGETAIPLERAVRAAVSSLVGGAIDLAGTEEGSTNLLTQLHGDHSAVSLSDLKSAVAQGQPVAAALLGERLGTATDLVRASSNVSATTATGVLAVGAPLVMAMLGKLHAADATEFGALLGGERSENLDAGPAAVTALVEDGGFSWRHILPMILMGLLLVCVPLLYKGCGSEPMAPEPTAKLVIPMPPDIKAEKLTLPDGGAITVIPGTINHALATFLASNEPAPKTFTFDHLNFEFNKTAITPESRPTLSDLVTILKAYKNVDVRLEGHTDATGNAAENKKLSLDRATAIKTGLQIDGIAANRITTAGWGQEKPVASNDTDAGRAKNRRLELVVVKK